MRTRPFLLQPVYRGGPLNRIEEFFSSQLKKYRENNKVFNEFLNDIRDVIIARKLDYCGNILLFIDGQPRGNWVCAGRSFFSMFIKLFNYDFSDEQAVDYIENCYQVYKRIMTTDYTLDKEYTVYQKRSRWDGATRDFININLTPINQIDDWDYYYWVNIDFCSLQNSRENKECLTDTEIKIRCSRDIYDDALALFDNYQNGSPFNQKMLETLIRGLRDRRIISEPIKMDYGHSLMLFYAIKKK